MPAPKISKTYPEIGTVDYYPRRQKNIKLSISGANIRISYPHRLSFKKVETFLHSKTAWILKNKIKAPVFTNGTRIGRRHQLQLISSGTKAYIQDSTIFMPSDDKLVAEELIKAALKQEASAILPPLVEAAATLTGLKPRQIKIRYMKSQWGSCTSRQDICLNSALIYLPNELITYVIIHELCHLKLLNHSARFWQLVEQHAPNQQALKKTLKAYRIGLIIKQP